jgi:H+/Cl- antiporter ClcA
MVTISDLLSFLAAGCLLAIVGEVAVRMVGPARRGWRRIYHQTILAHPILAGALLAFLDLPVPEGMGTGLSGRVIWFALAGGLSAVIYKGVRVFIASRAKGADLAPPPGPIP